MGILEPKDYQMGVLDTLKQMRKDGAHSALIALATGLGKTYTAAFDVEEYMSHSKGRLLLLCHNNDILDQNMAVFKEVLKDKFSYGLFNGIEKVPDADFVFATFQSMKNHKKEFAKDAFSYILVDEAHHAPAETFRTVIDYFQPDFLLGMTATPERADGLELESIFGPITYSLEVGEAIKSGLLVDITKMFWHLFYFFLTLLLRCFLIFSITLQILRSRRRKSNSLCFVLTTTSGRFFISKKWRNFFGYSFNFL